MQYWDILDHAVKTPGGQNPYVKLKSCTLLFAKNIHFICGMTFRICTEHGSDTAMLCAKCQTDLAIELQIMDQWDFTSVECNSLRPSDTRWRQRSGSTLPQLMACCLMAPSHNLNQCWLIISKVEWHSFKDEFTRDTSAINHWNYLEN